MTCNRCLRVIGPMETVHYGYGPGYVMCTTCRPLPEAWTLAANRSGKTRAVFGEMLAYTWPSLSWWQRLHVRWLLWWRGL